MAYWSNIIRGVAFGDAWGWPVEFMGIDQITKNDPKGTNMPSTLQITDDTQMSLFLGHALDESWGQNMNAVKDSIEAAFLQYYDDADTPGRAPGNTVMGSLSVLARGKVAWYDATNRQSDGSGTVMRTAATAFLPDDMWVGATAFAAAVTHGTSNGVAAAILDVAILRDLMRGRVTAGSLLAHAKDLADHAETLGLCTTGDWLKEGKGKGLELKIEDGFNTLSKLIEQVLERLPELRDNPWAITSDPSNLDGIYNSRRGGGWRAHETLVIALTAIDMMPADMPLGALRRAANTNGDSDTIGAVAGALLGALHPDMFIRAWEESKMRERFEKRYVAWIEQEADDYPFKDPEVTTLVGR